MLDFKDNPIKFLRIMKNMDRRGCWHWMKQYHSKESYFPGKIKQLQWALDMYYRYRDLKAEFKTLRALYKRYKNTSVCSANA